MRRACTKRMFLSTVHPAGMYVRRAGPRLYPLTARQLLQVIRLQNGEPYDTRYLRADVAQPYFRLPNRERGMTLRGMNETRLDRGQK